MRSIKRTISGAILLCAALFWYSQLALVTQQGPKLVGSGAVGNPVEQGTSAALSGDGNTAIVGARVDNNLIGAAWVFVRSHTDRIKSRGRIIAGIWWTWCCPSSRSLPIARGKWISPFRI